MNFTKKKCVLNVLYQKKKIKRIFKNSYWSWKLFPGPKLTLFPHLC